MFSADLIVINLSVPIPALLKSPLQMAVEEGSLCKFQKLVTHKFSWHAKISESFC